MSVNEMLMAAAGASGAANEFVEDCFATHLYTGNDSTQTITNGIDLAGEGGLVWTKSRSGTTDHVLFDTLRSSSGAGRYLSTNTTAAQATSFDTDFGGFNSNGYTLSGSTYYGALNFSPNTYVSFTFRKAPKFFDVVTYTGDGAGTRSISHSLGSAPGFVIVKRTDSTSEWFTACRRDDGSFLTGMILNGNGAALNSLSSDTTSSTEVIISRLRDSSGNSNPANVNGATYVMYVFAHNAGGFGASGSDNIISCGSYAGNGATNGGPTITLGYEPQYVLIKRATGSPSSWFIMDVMRGLTSNPAGGTDYNVHLIANDSGAEGPNQYIKPTATGFEVVSPASAVNASFSTYIYMAIRRPMKTPTTGTEVFSPVVSSAASGTKLTTGFPIDSQWINERSGSSSNTNIVDRLRATSTNTTQSGGNMLITSSTAAEDTGAIERASYWDNTGFQMPGWYAGTSMVFLNFRRATGFFDQVCYTGNGNARTIAHNLGVAPELMIVKRRNSTGNWRVYESSQGNTKYASLNGTSEFLTSSVFWNNTSPTSSVFTVGTDASVNASGGTYVAYLFATLAGISKIGNYTGNGSNQTINCGFSAGARFVLIKRTDVAGDWCVFDTARGIVSGTDPFLQLNSTAAEVTGQDAVDPANSGFVVNQTPENLNVNNATYLFLAIA